jgi:hypothetical protein
LLVKGKKNMIIHIRPPAMVFLHKSWEIINRNSKAIMISKDFCVKATKCRASITETFHSQKPFIISLEKNSKKFAT